MVSLGVVRAGERKCAHQSWRGKGTGANELELNEVKRLSVEVSELFLSRQNIGGFDFQLIDGTNKRERIELQGTTEESEQKPRREGDREVSREPKRKRRRIKENRIRLDYRARLPDFGGAFHTLYSVLCTITTLPPAELGYVTIHHESTWSIEGVLCMNTSTAAGLECLVLEDCRYALR